MSRLNENDPMPLYHQLKKILSEKILNGEWGPETQIPTEEQLVSEYEVSRSTVRSAVLDLMRSGVLYRKRGRGTFVAPSKVDSETLGNFYFSKEFDADDTHKNIFLTRNPAARWLSEKLELENPNEEIFEFVRLRYFRTELAGIEKIYIPVKYCPDLQQNPPIRKFSNWLENAHSITLQAKEKTIEATIFDKEESRMLNVENGSAALLYIRLNGDQNGNLISFAKTILRGDMFRLIIPLSVEGWFIGSKK